MIIKRLKLKYMDELSKKIQGNEANTLLCTVIFKTMIIVWNNNHGDMYGFKDIEEYKEWIMKNKDEIDGFDNSVYDVKTGEKCTDENQVDLHEWNCNVLYPYGA